MRQHVSQTKTHMLGHKEIYQSAQCVCLLAMENTRAAEEQQEMDCWILEVDTTEEMTWAIKVEHPQFTEKVENPPCF